jgi:hypothetical protein
MTTLIVPVEVPLPQPVSFAACHVCKAWIPVVTIAYEGTEAVGGATTVMGTSVTHGAPRLPHDFTCSVCVPIVVETPVLIDVLYTTGVLVLLSSE